MRWGIALGFAADFFSRFDIFGEQVRAVRLEKLLYKPYPGIHCLKRYMRLLKVRRRINH
jgi:hypothetical protein